VSIFSNYFFPREKINFFSDFWEEKAEGGAFCWDHGTVENGNSPALCYPSY
jgi:hypothetical protein